MLSYGFQYAFYVFEQLMIPEPQHAVAPGFKVSRALCIILLLFQVRRDIQLDDQLVARGAEINNIGADGMLAAEMGTVRGMRSQHLP